MPNAARVAYEALFLVVIVLRFLPRDHKPWLTTPFRAIPLATGTAVLASSQTPTMFADSPCAPVLYRACALILHTPRFRPLRTSASGASPRPCLLGPGTVDTKSTPRYGCGYFILVGIGVACHTQSISLILRAR